MVGWSEMPRSPGHVFYDRLQSVLVEADFDAFIEATCKPYYAARLGAPSVPPGRYFRMHLVGYFEVIDSERGLEWRCSDSPSLREFLRLESRARVGAESVKVIVQKAPQLVWPGVGQVKFDHVAEPDHPDSANPPHVLAIFARLHRD